MHYSTALHKLCWLKALKVLIQLCSLLIGIIRNIMCILCTLTKAESCLAANRQSSLRKLLRIKITLRRAFTPNDRNWHTRSGSANCDDVARDRSFNKYQSLTQVHVTLSLSYKIICSKMRTAYALYFVRSHPSRTKSPKILYTLRSPEVISKERNNVTLSSWKLS